MTSEPFGPISAVAPFDSLEVGLERANRSTVGLAGYVFTQSSNTAIEVSEKLEVGIVGINTYAVSNTEAPFGGVKDSGYGLEGGAEGLAAYLSFKSISQV